MHSKCSKQSTTMERQLTIEDLAPLAPHKLEVDWKGQKCDLFGVDMMEVTLFGPFDPHGSGNKIERTQYLDIKPYVRGLWQITEEIEHDGEVIVRLSTSRIGTTSAAVPVKNASSAT